MINNNRKTIRNIYIVLGTFIVLSSCNLPEIKELKHESKQEMDSIIEELELEQLSYSYHSKTTNGKSKDVFHIDLWNIDDSTDFKAYNDRLISIFEKSDFELLNQNYIQIAYFKKYIPVDLYVYYNIDPKTRQIIKEGTK